MNNEILFIGPKFYNYHSLIYQKLTKYGNVIFFPEKIPNFIFSIFNTLMPSSIDVLQKVYFYYILFKLRNKKNITHLFVIRAYKMPNFFLRKIKANYPDIKLIMYQWDSCKNNNYLDLIPYFDDVFTFDHQDSLNINSLKFLQLFFTDEIKSLRENSYKNIYKYDLLCICSFSTDRYNLINQLITNEELFIKAIVYIPYSTYLKFKYLKGLKLNRDILTFKPIAKEVYLQFLTESNIVIDFSHSTQSGLSMRVIEGLGAGKKIITTNKYSIKNPIYDEKYIIFKEIDDIKKISKSELRNFESNNIPVFDEFHIDKWLEKMIVC